MLNEVSDVEDNYLGKKNNYGSSEEINEATETVENNGQSFQIMSIDQSGLAKIWVNKIIQILIINNYFFKYNRYYY